MRTFDFASARLHHTNWRLRLRAYLAGPERITEAELVSPHECALGKWLDGDGIKAYGQQAEMQELYRIHVGLHKLAAEIVKERNAGRLPEAKALHAELEPITDRILELLTLLEKQEFAKEEVAAS